MSSESQPITTQLEDGFLGALVLSLRFFGAAGGLS